MCLGFSCSYSYICLHRKAFLSAKMLRILSQRSDLKIMFVLPAQSIPHLKYCLPPPFLTIFSPVFLFPLILLFISSLVYFFSYFQVTMVVSLSFSSIFIFSCKPQVLVTSFGLMQLSPWFIFLRRLKGNKFFIFSSFCFLIKFITILHVTQVCNLAPL